MQHARPNPLCHASLRHFVNLNLSKGSLFLIFTVSFAFPQCSKSTFSMSLEFLISDLIDTQSFAGVDKDISDMI